MMTDVEPSSGTVADYTAPLRLTAENRLEERRGVLEAIERVAARGEHELVVDLGATVEMDASGLGVLILAQKRARERGLRTRLKRVPFSVLQILDATRLYPLFEVERA